MRKYILLGSVIISCLIFPVVSHASYLILLKNGGEFLTSRYWEEDGEVKFHIAGGVMGIEKNTVRKIDRSAINVGDIYEVTAPGKRPEEAEPKDEISLLPKKSPEKVDLGAYQDKMAKLKTEINKTLMRLKKATINKDLDAKEEAEKDNRKISAEMWKLTDELKEKNNGNLPADWWEGVGREEPQIQ